MIVYILVGLMILGIGSGFVRSAMFRQLTRGRGADAGRFGSQLDHFFDQQGTGQSWNDDGRGRRDSHIDSPHTRRHR
jgi:hypothetical protein